MNDLPDEFLEFLKRELTPEKLAGGFTNLARSPDDPEVRIQVTPEIANKIVTNPATSYGLGTGLIFEAACADDIRKLPGGDTVKIFSARSDWLQENEDPEWLDQWNPEGIPSKPGLYRFRVFPR